MAKAKQSAEPIRLNLGCGQNRIEGFTGVDIMPGADVVLDLFKPKWPWKDNSVDAIECLHFIEHVPSLIDFMNECHRILKPGGQMHVIAPYYTSIRCWQDPTHKNAISEVSFMYYNADWRKANKLDHYPITADFDFAYGYAFNPIWQARSDEARQFALAHYWNVVSDIEVTLTKKVDT
jgi:predicted SAM-dependent methyltransferase